MNDVTMYDVNVFSHFVYPYTLASEVAQNKLEKNHNETRNVSFFAKTLYLKIEKGNRIRKQAVLL